MITVRDGVGYTFDVNEISVREMEQGLFESIASNGAHVVVPGYLSDSGYIGRSTAIEFAWALRHGKVVYITASYQLGGGVPDICAQIISSRRSAIVPVHFERMSQEDVRSLFASPPRPSRPPGALADLESQLDAYVEQYLLEFD